MTATLGLAARPGPAADSTTRSRYRTVGLVLALVGLAGATLAAIGNFVAAGSIDATSGFAETLAWTFGVTTFSFGVIKLGIAVILMGIVVRLWMRVDAVRDGLRRLRGHSTAEPPATGTPDTEFGRATVTDDPPRPLIVHRLARVMWLPSLVMGTMALVVGLIGSFTWASATAGTETFRRAAAVTQGVEFLGETFLLAGIAFLLGTILAALRDGGGEVQSSLGIPVTTLKMPFTAKAFLVGMMVGMMLGVTQFVLYLVAAGFADDAASFTTWANVLGPLRELALGIILASIVLALVTIGNVLRFQFGRIQSIIHTGQ